MDYFDELFEIRVLRGPSACELGERGLMVKNWKKFSSALEKELVEETDSRDDGHTGYDAILDLLISRMIERGTPPEDMGISKKPDDGPNECWPFDEDWFNCK